MVRLHQELVAQGFKGSSASVRDHIIRRLPDGKKNGANSSELARTLLTSRQATFLFLARPEQLETEEQEAVQTLCQSHRRAWIWPMISFSSLPPCYVLAQENTLIAG